MLGDGIQGGEGLTALDQLILGNDFEPIDRRTLFENIDIEVIESSDVWPAYADPGQLVPPRR